MKKKKWAMWLGGLLLAILVANSMGFFSSINAANGETPITENIIKSVTLSVYESDGTQVTDTVYKIDSTIRLDLTYELPEDEDNNPIYTGNSTYTYKLPDQLQIDKEMTDKLYFNDSPTGDVGTYTVKTDNTVVFNFNNISDYYSQIKGTFWVKIKLSQTRTTGSTVQVLPFPISGNPDYAITIQIKPEKGSVITKSGIPLPQKYNANKIEWTVDVNTLLNKLSDAAITDTMLNGQELDLTSIAVYPLAVKINGDLTPGSQPVSAGLYSIDGSDKDKLNIKFNYPVSEAYRVKFTTKLPVTETTTYTNKAILTANGTSQGEANGSVGIELGQTLEKIGGSYDLADESINWEIRYNYNEKAITADKAVLKDYFNKTQDLVDSSIVIYKMKISSDGTATNDGTLVRDTDYTITTLTDRVGTQNGFQISFNNDIQNAYKIIYNTKSNIRVYEKQTITNEVNYNGIKKTADVSTAQQILTKQDGYDIDYENKTVKWTIKINEDEKTMSNLVLTDTFNLGGLKLIGLPNASPDYSITPVGSTFGKNDGFIITFNKVINQPYTITYTTNFDLYSLTSGKTFENTASINWTENTSGSPYTSIGKFDPDIKVKNNGLKTGSYDVLSKQITWKVGANYNKRVLPAGAYLVDTLPASQILSGDITAIKVYKLTYGASGSPQPGTPVDSADYTASLIDNGQKLRVEFTKQIDYAFYVEFKTKFKDDDVNLKTVTNSATLYNAGNTAVSEKLTGDASVIHGGEYIAKSGAVDGSDNTLVNWQLIINANQSRVGGVQIIDTPSTNQVLLPESFQLYTTLVKPNGDVEPTSTTLEKDKDYTLVISTDSSGNDSFKLTFKNEIAEPYILKYKTAITAVDTVKVTNYVAFSGSGYTQVNTSTSTTDSVFISESGGTGSGIRGSLKLTKTNTDSTKVLAGAEFSLKRKVGTDLVAVTGSFKSDANGVISFPNLRLGKYVLKETKAPAGYILDTTSRPVTINSTTPAELTLTNDPYGSFKVIKVDKDDGAKLLAGAKFELFNASKVSLNKFATTGANGEAVFADVKFGDYFIKEVTAPYGYDLDSTMLSVKIDSEVLKVLDPIKNTATIGSLKVIKVDAVSGKKLEGAKFELSNTSGVQVAAATTNASGEVIFPNLKVASYKLEEVKAPAGYDLDGTIRNISITSKDQQTLEVKNTSTMGSLKFDKVDAADATKKLAGAKFGLFNSSDTKVYEATSSPSGEVIFTNLNLGDYKLKEIEAPAGYEVSASVIDVKISEKSQKILASFPNKAKTGSLKFLKVDAADGTKKLAGAKFDLYNAVTNGFVASVITEASGEVIFTDLKFGDYKLVEVTAPTGYVLDSTVRNIKIDSTTQLVLGPIKNTKTVGSLKLSKVDYSNVNKKLAGAEFRLTNTSTNVAVTDITNSDGEIEFNNLNLGDYTLVETKAPYGYDLDARVRNVKIVSDVQLVLTPISNIETIGSIKLVKVDAADAAKKLEGAVFKLTNSSKTVIGTKTTNEFGEIVFDNLKVGVYTLEEIGAPAGYDLDGTPQNITIDSKVQKVLDPIKNQETLGSLKLVKVDAADSAKKLIGAEFKLTNIISGKAVTDTTNGDGELVFKDLKLGKYTLEETKAPAGYDLDATVHNITISAKAQQVLDPIKNVETLGSLKLVKVDAADGTKKLEGAEFKLTNTATKTVVTGTTKENGELVFSDLKLGTYTLQETGAPAGYDLDATVRNITITEKAQQVLAPITNQETLGSLKLVKVDAADSANKLIGAEFKLTNTTTGKVVTGTTKVNGELVFEDLKLGKYTLEETKAPAGYDLDATVHNVTISAKAQQVLDPIKNVETLGSLKLVKVDAGDSTKKLIGAEFKLTNTATKTVVTGTTNADGEIIFPDLKLGSYTLQETEAPAGYDLDATVRNITITEKAQQVLAPITNQETLGSLKLVKVDAADSAKKLIGAEFKLTNTTTGKVATGTTNVNGELVFNDLKLGAYTLQETEAPTGYDLDATVHNITISGKAQQVLAPIKNVETLGSLKLVKVDAGDSTKKLIGAEFKLTNTATKTVVTGTTNGDGELVFNDLKLGSYTLQETEAPAGYDLDATVRNITITVKAQQVLAPITNQETLGSLKLVKVDAADDAKKLTGAEFKLTNTSTGKVVTGTTNVNGELVFNDLKLGAYTMQETEAPAGYDLNAAVRNITISGKAQQVLAPIKNVETLGSLKLVKVDAADTAKKLAGAKFKLTNSSNVVVATGTTNASGEIIFPDLKLGSYTLQETEAPAGFNLDATVRNVTISGKTQQVLPPITNQETLGSIKVVKVAEGNEARKLAGAEFKLYDSSKNVVATAVTDVNGEIEFKDLKLGKYTLKETVAPTGYYLDSTERSITIDSKVQKVLDPITNKDIPAPTGAPGPNPGVTPTATPVGTAAPVATVTPAPSATGAPGTTVTPGPTAVPTAAPTQPATSSAPAVTPQATSATTVEDIPINGEIPLGGIPEITVQPSHGTVVVTPDGKWTYTPDPGFIGKDKFTITVTDEDGNEQDVIIEVGVDEVPTGSVTNTDNGTDTDSGGKTLPGNLPKTGEDSPLPLYLLGGGLIVAGIVLARKFKTRNKPE
ncbi:SpaA isopeptide-forming pilin-related protein [Paenibacillus sp. MMS20-IR301]|uniref:SpaA isopeptide-forming pilin-related protein n=1 Tax=Paenibacillus sp. MMS20-IR301 TaxID=2895946 RepID=UPI0028E1C1C8|nr:SpaA isopeptide-forming pilin-related protein [Paenibacillus sp. MMS20-IR301]WNS40916.1 SpaA isopeptide-forming pilin-related protein [Paenibacillus sp. MMS20-IR301]